MYGRWWLRVSSRIHGASHVGGHRHPRAVACPSPADVQFITKALFHLAFSRSDRPLASCRLRRLQATLFIRDRNDHLVDLVPSSSQPSARVVDHVDGEQII